MEARGEMVTVIFIRPKVGYVALARLTPAILNA
jgi:hypothetical protein